MKGVRVVSSEVLYEGKLRGVRDIVETDDGRRFPHETIEHPGAVVIAPILADGRIVFVEQYRHSIKDLLLELPAGTLEHCEDPLICAKREITEEVGLQGNEWHSLGELLPAPGFSNELQHLFLTKDLYECKGTPDYDEMITPVVLSLDEVNEAIRSGRLRDAKSIALLAKARLFGLL